MAYPVSMVRVVDKLARAANQLRALEKSATQLRERIRLDILNEIAAGATQQDIAHRTGWTRETIRKIQRRAEASRMHD